MNLRVRIHPAGAVGIHDLRDDATRRTQAQRRGVFRQIEHVHDRRAGRKRSAILDRRNRAGAAGHDEIHLARGLCGRIGVTDFQRRLIELRVTLRNRYLRPGRLNGVG